MPTLVRLYEWACIFFFFSHCICVSVYGVKEETCVYNCMGASKWSENHTDTRTHWLAWVCAIFQRHIISRNTRKAKKRIHARAISHDERGLKTSAFNEDRVLCREHKRYFIYAHSQTHTYTHINTHHVHRSTYNCRTDSSALKCDCVRVSSACKFICV